MKAEGLRQELISEVKDGRLKWEKEDFSYHLYFGMGQTVTLSQAGYLGEIIQKAREIMFHRVEEQVADKMREIRSGNLVYTTERGYPRLGEVFWVFGGGIIRTRTEGIVSQNGNTLSIQAHVEYEYGDIFTDIANIREYTPFVFTSEPEEAFDWYVKLTDGGGTYFRITDRWKTRMTGSISLKNKKN